MHPISSKNGGGCSPRVMARASWGGGTATETASWGGSTARERGTTATARARGDGDGEGAQHGDGGDSEGDGDGARQPGGVGSLWAAMTV